MRLPLGTWLLAVLLGAVALLLVVLAVQRHVEGRTPVLVHEVRDMLATWAGLGVPGGLEAPAAAPAWALGVVLAALLALVAVLQLRRRRRAAAQQRSRSDLS